jgi:hypothetical protein
MSSNNAGDNVFILSYSDSQKMDDGSCDGRTRTITIDTKDLAAREYLKMTDEDGQRFQSLVARNIIYTAR